MNQQETIPDHVLERRKMKWFLGFISVVLVLTIGTDLIMSLYGTPFIPKERNPFVFTEETPTPAANVAATSPVALPSKTATITQTMRFCPQDAKLCPDKKTYVGRSGPTCEFVACPTKK